MKARQVFRIICLTVPALLVACGGRQVAAPVSERGPADVVPADGFRYGNRVPGHYTVRKGDTLYAIAWRHQRDYRELARWNGIRHPYTIYVGQRLRVTPPAGAGAEKSVASRPAPAAKAPPETRRAGPASPPSPTPGPNPAPKPVPATPADRGSEKPEPTPVKPPASAAPNGVVRWQWPADGTVLKRFSNAGAGNRGVDIGGEMGDPVRAAAGGKVVYSGSGLRGYGQLIIVKHNDNFLSAYAHNSRLLVREGESVRTGQKVAEMGRTEAERVMVHFEIRRDGEPVDPLRYLPRR